MRSQNLIANLKRELIVPASSNFKVLDGLRGFASCIVVFFHCAIFMGFYSGELGSSDSWVILLSNGFWTGIDIFFVLSGFLIGRILIADLASHNKLNYKAFLIRRTFRIFPAYYFVVTVSLFLIAPLGIPAFSFMYGTAIWSDLFNSSWANYFYLVNYVYSDTVPSVLSWGWSLSVEEHFYLILPAVLLFLFKTKSKTLVLGGLIAAILIPFLGRLIQYLNNPDIILLDGFYYYSHNRFDEIFVGVLIAYFYVLHKEKLETLCKQIGGYWLGGLGLSGAASVWFFGGLTKQGMFAVVFQFLLMALSAGLLVLNGLFLDNRLNRFLSHRFWYLLARISYGTYLLHPFFIFGLLQIRISYFPDMQFTGAHLIIFYLLVMLFSTLAAGVMFLCLEAPFLRIGSRLAKAAKAD